jgi:hypothetical protein
MSPPANNWRYIQYWCIDGKYRIYVARLRNRGKTSFMTRVWLNSYIRIMWKVLLWQGCGLIALLGKCEKCYYDTVIIKPQFISTLLLWQKITQLQDKTNGEWVDCRVAKVVDFWPQADTDISSNLDTHFLKASWFPDNYPWPGFFHSNYDDSLT